MKTKHFLLSISLLLSIVNAASAMDGGKGNTLPINSLRGPSEDVLNQLANRDQPVANDCDFYDDFNPLFDTNYLDIVSDDERSYDTQPPYDSD